MRKDIYGRYSVMKGRYSVRKSMYGRYSVRKGPGKGILTF